MTPDSAKLHRSEGSLTLGYPDGSSFTLSGEYLRVYSPSAEVKGHGPGQEVLQHGKRNVKITAVEPAGNYALRLIFSDNHDSGIYSWDYLRSLCVDYRQNWDDYLARLAAAGKHRDLDTQVVKLVAPSK